MSMTAGLLVIDVITGNIYSLVHDCHLLQKIMQRVDVRDYHVVSSS